MNTYHLALTIVFALLTACDSSSVVTNEGRASFGPPIDVHSEFLATNRSEPQIAAANTENLFSNEGFESSLEGWTPCEEGSIEVSQDSISGERALLLNPGHCFFRSVQIEEQESYELSCQMKLLANQGWTGMGLSFENDKFEQIAAAPTAIATAHEYRRYQTRGIAPLGSSFASMWIYSENPVVVDDCQLTTTTRRSLPVDTGTLDFALLNNSDFSLVDANGQPLYWSIGCDGSSLVDDSLELRDGACADQSFSDSDIGSFVEFKHIAYRCALKNVSGYSDMSIFFDGELQKSVEITESEIGSFVGFIFELEHMPLNGFASLYTEGVLEVDDCVMFFV